MKDSKKILSVIFGACAVLKVMTSNEDAWGHTFAAIICGTCALAGGVATLDSINKACKSGKATANIVNKGADITQKTISKGLGQGPDLS